MKEVLVGRIYQEFSEVLLKSENSIKISQEAFKIVSGWLPLGKVVLEVTLIPGENNYILEKKIVSRPLFIKDREEVLSDYQEKFSFGPADNNICFLCTSTTDDGHFTEEEAEHLKAFLSEMYIHVERMYLGKGLQKAYVTQRVTGLPNQAGYMARVAAHVKKSSYDEYTSFYFNLRGFGLLNYEFSEKEPEASRMETPCKAHRIVRHVPLHMHVLCTCLIQPIPEPVHLPQCNQGMNPQSFLSNLRNIHRMQ